LGRAGNENFQKRKFLLEIPHRFLGKLGQKNNRVFPSRIIPTNMRKGPFFAHTRVDLVFEGNSFRTKSPALWYRGKPQSTVYKSPINAIIRPCVEIITYPSKFGFSPRLSSLSFAHKKLYEFRGIIKQRKL
jgi:hypothetical protein